SSFRFKQLFENCPCLQKCLDTIPAIFAADAGVFESAPGCLRIVRHAVNYNATGSQLRGNAACSLNVGADNGGMKTISRVVSDSDRIVLGVVRDDTEHGAKNLFLGDCH